MAWELLGYTKLGSAQNTITVAGFTAKKFLCVEISTPGASNAGVRTRLRFNSDTGSNYADRASNNGSSDSTNTSQSFVYVAESDSQEGELDVIYIINIEDEEKLVINQNVRSSATGAGTAPSRYNGVGKWTNTSAQITTIDVFAHPTDTADKYDADSEVTVYGTD